MSGAKIIRAHVASMYSAFSERFFLCALTSIKQPGTDIPPTSKWTSSKPTQHSTRRKHGERRARAGADVAELYYSMFLYSLLQSINLVNVGSILWCIFCSFLLVKLCRNILENGLQTKVFTIFLFLQKKQHVRCHYLFWLLHIGLQHLLASPVQRNGRRCSNFVKRI